MRGPRHHICRRGRRGWMGGGHMHEVQALIYQQKRISASVRLGGSSALFCTGVCMLGPCCRAALHAWQPPAVIAWPACVGKDSSLSVDSLCGGGTSTVALDRDKPCRMVIRHFCELGALTLLILFRTLVTPDNPPERPQLLRLNRQGSKT